MSDQRKGWLRAIKPGDRVIWGTTAAFGPITESEVLRVTPTGRIVVKVNDASTLTFSPSGWETGTGLYTPMLKMIREHIPSSSD